MRTCAIPTRTCGEGTAVNNGSGVSMNGVRLVAYRIGTSVRASLASVSENGSMSPMLKATGVGISRTGVWQPASRVIAASTDRRAARPRDGSGGKMDWGVVKAGDKGVTKGVTKDPRARSLVAAQCSGAARPRDDGGRCHAEPAPNAGLTDAA
jgi:hypothetical protein